MAQLGKILAKLRQERRLTKEQLGQVLCVSAGTISNYEKGVHLPDADKLIMLADYFHVSTDYLLGRTRIQETQTDFQKKILENKMTFTAFNTFLNLPKDLQKSFAHILSSLELILAAQSVFPADPDVVFRRSQRHSVFVELIGVDRNILRRKGAGVHGGAAHPGIRAEHRVHIQTSLPIGLGQFRLAKGCTRGVSTSSP